MIPLVSLVVVRSAVRGAVARQVRGFSLIELMVTVAVLAVVAAAGLPEFGRFVRDVKLGSLASDLRADMQFARSESIRRNARVLVCPRSTSASVICATTVTATTWSNGWLVCYDVNADGVCDIDGTGNDPNPTRVHAAPASTMSLSGPTAVVTYFPTGNANGAATFTMTGGTSVTRTLSVAPSGSLTSTKT
jgi:type IV fimbrial biogenesis protein FimT